MANDLLRELGELQQKLLKDDRPAALSLMVLESKLREVLEKTEEKIVSTSAERLSAWENASNRKIAQMQEQVARLEADYK